MQVNGRNFLIPVDAEIESEADVTYFAVDAGFVLGKMEDAGNGLNIVILDACRDNPFARSFRSAEKGLARMNAPKGSIIAYATAPGSVAVDGEGRNGIYTRHLMRHMNTPGLPLERVLKKARVDVMAETGDRQVPWEASSLVGDFYFAAGSGAVTETPRPVAEPAASKFGELTVRANVKATVWFGDAKMGKTPIKLTRIVPGEHEIRVSSDGYGTYRKRLRFEPGASKQMTAWLNKNGPMEIDRDGRFIAYNNGTMLNTESGLMWAAKDNGEDINWKDAKQYCDNYRGGGYSDWRMPKKDELIGLYDKNVKNPNPSTGGCGGGYHLTRLIHLTCCCPWASETKNGSTGYFVNFGSGYAYWFHRTDSDDFRALPVRIGK